MVKKTIVFLLLTMYTVAVLGLPVNRHFCRGELKKLTFFKTESCHERSEDKAVFACCLAKKGKSCHEEDQGECCDNEPGILKAEIVQISAKVAQDELADQADFAFLPIGGDIQYTGREQISCLSQIRIPPDPVKRYLRYCTLTFYG